jgi:dephospho-CoA kinase
MLKLGLTGGIGSGKSTVAAILAKQGALVVDADAISRATTAAGGAAIPHISSQFGVDFVDSSGALNRERMRERVFSDPEAKKRLESIIHPLVGQAIAARTQEALSAGMRCVVYDIPLLVESGHWRKSLDRVLVVDCSEATQVQRVVARNALPASEVEKIIASQASRQRRLGAADAVLANDGISLLELTALAHEIGRQFGL